MMALPEATLPETRERRCLSCRSEAIASLGHIITADGMIKVRHRCEVCGTALSLVREAKDPRLRSR